MNDIYTFTVPIYLKILGGLKNVLAKAKADVAAGKFEEKALIEDRLAPDMFPFARQVQIACDHAKNATAHLTGLPMPRLEDNETTLDELMARIDTTIKLLTPVTEENFKGAGERTIEISYIPGKFMTGFDYAREYAIPNFFFHVSMAYALVRKNDVAIGKADFVNGINLQDLPAA